MNSRLIRARSVTALLASVLVAGSASNASAADLRAEADSILDLAVKVRPTPQQLAWQRQEVTAFIHFGMNTFTDAELGTGKEDPSLFNPTDLDCEQWVKAALTFGAKSVVVVAKHADGFCLWPSRHTEHSVKRSPWKHGSGDVIREISTACARHGLGLGIYLSPSDLNHPAYGRDHAAYNRYVMAQLDELLGDYGPVREMWFDGWTPPGPLQRYDWQAIYGKIRRKQPDCLIAIRGPDIRWVGNEFGHAREDEWSVVPLPSPPDKYDWPDMTGTDLGSRSRLAGAACLWWYPAVANTPLRQSWFYHAREDVRLKTVAELADLYFRSVGRNSVLLLNLSPDRRGKIPEQDVQRLQEWAQWHHATFATNLLGGASILVGDHESRRGGAPERATILDGSVETSWALPTNADGTVELCFRLPKEIRFNVLAVQEAIEEGQRIEAFSWYAWIENRWQPIARGQAVGHKRLLRATQAVETDRLKLRLERSRARPILAGVGAYFSLPH